MIAAAILLQMAPVPPADWTTLPVFPLPRAGVVTDGSAYVRGEVTAGRCRPSGERELVATVAILVGPSGNVGRIVPLAIGCPTVEQYTVGYLLSLTRGGPGSARVPAPGWYRLSVTYRW